MCQRRVRENVRTGACLGKKATHQRAERWYRMGGFSNQMDIGVITVKTLVRHLGRSELCI